MAMNPRLLRPTGRSRNPETLDWISRVYANGGTVSTSTANAVNTFCNAIDAAGIRDRFYRLSLLCGNNIQAALIPLYRSTSFGGTLLGLEKDENVGFVSGDYSLSGSFDATNNVSLGKYIRCNARPFSSMFPSGDDRQEGHLCAAFTGSSSTQVDAIAGVNTGVSGEQYYIGSRVGVSRFQQWGSRLNTWTNPDAGRHIAVVTRNSGTNSFYADGASISTSTGASTTSDVDCRFAVYATGSAAGSDAVAVNFEGRVYAYSLGDGLDATQAAAYYTALAAFLDAIGRTA